MLVGCCHPNAVVVRGKRLMTDGWWQSFPYKLLDVPLRKAGTVQASGARYLQRGVLRCRDA